MHAVSGVVVNSCCHLRHANPAASTHLQKHSISACLGQGQEWLTFAAESAPEWFHKGLRRNCWQHSAVSALRELHAEGNLALELEPEGLKKLTLPAMLVEAEQLLTLR